MDEIRALMEELIRTVFKEVDLREFRLTVGAKVFVAEALDDLIVAVEAGDHQELLEELRRLRQDDAMAQYGSDKPDLRVNLKLVEVTDVVENSTRRGS